MCARPWTDLFLKAVVKVKLCTRSARFKMKATLSVYAVGSVLLVIVLAIVAPAQPQTTAIKCGRGMIATVCAPCNQVCNSEPVFCPLYCTEDIYFCQCKENYSLPSANSNYCIPNGKCPRKECPKSKDTPVFL